MICVRCVRSAEKDSPSTFLTREATRRLRWQTTKRWLQGVCVCVFVSERQRYRDRQRERRIEIQKLFRESKNTDRPFANAAYTSVSVGMTVRQLQQQRSVFRRPHHRHAVLPENVLNPLINIFVRVAYTARLTSFRLHDAI